MSDPDTTKISLPKYLKLLELPIVRSMAVAKLIYKDFDTPAKLSHLTDAKLVSLGVTSKEERASILKAVRKAGYIPKLPDTSKDAGEGSASSSTSALPAEKNVSPSTSGKKRKKPTKEEVLDDSQLDFKEILEEKALMTRSSVVNRAPVMTAWATIVAERLGFKREEALSIASVYTELNAISKGVYLGRFEKGKGDHMEADRNGTQPYVELMGRRPLIQTQDKQWRALSKNSPVQPNQAFSYISRSFKQTMPHVLGAMKLLADSFSESDLSKSAWRLYTDFRPSVGADSWGEKSIVHCKTILNLRNKSKVEEKDNTFTAVTGQHTEESPASIEQPPTKKIRAMTLEEYEEMLDQELGEDPSIYNSVLDSTTG